GLHALCIAYGLAKHECFRSLDQVGGFSCRPQGCGTEQAALHRSSAIRGFRGAADRIPRQNRGGVRIASADPHGKLDVLREWRGHVARGGRAHPLQVLGTEVGVVGDNERARPQAALHQAQHLGIKRLAPSSSSKSIVSGRSTLSVLSASPSRISTRSISPPSVRFFRARATLDGSNSLVIRRPPPLSLSAAPRSTVDIPNEVPNSPIFPPPD